jgi:hypothetical protein
MDNQSWIVMILSVAGTILLIVALVSLFYKPAKRLSVICTYKDVPEGETGQELKIVIENDGKRNIDILSPYIRFSTAAHSKIFQIKSEKVHCKFPKIIKIGETMSCEIDLYQYKESMLEHTFHPSHLSVIIKDTAGLEFTSAHLHYKI